MVHFTWKLTIVTNVQGMLKYKQEKSDVVNHNDSYTLKKVNL